jgi:outer membrane lipoprotein-sorting protein
MKILVLLLACSAASAQTASNPQTDKAEQVLQKALAALGGPNYLNVKTVTGRGLFTQMKDGAPEAVSEFVDFIAWPDRERTEFKSSAGRFLQVNTGDTGWFFDGRMKAFKDATPEQAAEFKTYLRTTVDNLLRGFWRAEKAALSYAGRREAGLGRRNEVVKLTYPDGFEIEFEFGAQDGLPAKTVYRKQNAQGVTGREEDRYAQFVNSGGVLAPFIIDHFREDKQTSRINYNSITFNSPLPADLFAKPAAPKAVKWNF